MNRACLTVTGFLVLSAYNSLAQSDRTFPNNEAYWLISVGELDPWFNWYTHDHEILYMHNPQIESQGRSWGTVYRGDPIGLIAVDSGKVFYRSTAPYVYSDLGFGYFDTTTQVLYNFNLLVGDTAYAEQEPITVLAIDTVTLWGQARKHLMLSNEDEWIEGVGSVNGLFRPFAATWGLEAVSYTMVDFCGYYMDADSLPYTMCLPDAIPEFLRRGFSVAPNPTFGSFAIRSHMQKGTFTIRNMNGAILHSGLITGPETHVDLPELPAGMYLVRTNDRYVKLIVQ